MGQVWERRKEKRKVAVSGCIGYLISSMLEKVKKIK